MTTEQTLPTKDVAEKLLGEHYGLPIQGITYLISRSGGEFGENRWDIDDLLIAYFGEDAFNEAVRDWMGGSADTSHFG